MIGEKNIVVEKEAIGCKIEIVMQLADIQGRETFIILSVKSFLSQAYVLFKVGLGLEELLLSEEQKRKKKKPYNFPRRC